MQSCHLSIYGAVLIYATLDVNFQAFPAVNTKVPPLNLPAGETKVQFGKRSASCLKESVGWMTSEGDSPYRSTVLMPLPCCSQ